MKKIGKWILYFLLALLALSFIGGVMSGASDDVSAVEADDESETSPYETLESFDIGEREFDDYVWRNVQVVQYALKQKMKDPESTQFKDMRYVKARAELPATVCGKVTSKNSFNAQSGYKLFLVKMDDTGFAMQGTTDNFENMYNMLCVKS